MTDENGSCSLRGYMEDLVAISAPGYEKRDLLVQDILNNSDRG